MGLLDELRALPGEAIGTHAEQRPVYVRTLEDTRRKSARELCRASHV